MGDWNPDWLDPESPDFKPELALSPDVVLRTDDEDIVPAGSLEEVEAGLAADLAALTATSSTAPVSTTTVSLPGSTATSLPSSTTSTSSAAKGYVVAPVARLPKGAARIASIARILKQKEGEDGEEGETVSAMVASKKRREVRTLGRQLGEEEGFKGPLSVLTACLNTKRKVVVYVRDRARLRSKLTAFITAFDKHWNLLLTDVHEVYYRSKSRGVLRSNRLDKYSFEPPKELLFTSIDNHYANHIETLRRHCPFLFVRGENVILLSVPKDSAL